MKKSAGVWQFVRHGSGSSELWIWRRLRADGALEEVSPPHETLGKAVADALAHGFKPRSQLWETRTGNWITRYRPGKPPSSTPNAVLSPPGASDPLSVRKRAPRNRMPSKVLKRPGAKPLSADAGKPPARKSHTRRPE
jgi:hypothetical protein